jgi:hypothetical protein
MQYSKVLLIAALACLSSRVADAQSNGNNGNGNLRWPNLQSLSTVNRTQYGLSNTSTTNNAEVLCPFNLSNEVGDAFGVTVYNRNGLESLSCGLFELDSSGNVTATSTRSVTGALGSGAQKLVWLSPALSANMFVDCEIPPESSGQVSWVTSFGWGVS